LFTGRGWGNQADSQQTKDQKWLTEGTKVTKVDMVDLATETKTGNLTNQPAGPKE